VMFVTTVSSIGYIKAGRLRALAVTTATRLETLPDLPTVAEFAPGYEASPWFGEVRFRGDARAADATSSGGLLNYCNADLREFRSRRARSIALALEKPKGFTARAGAEAVLCVPLRNIDDVNGPVTLAGNEQFVTAKCHVHRLTANLDCSLPSE